MFLNQDITSLLIKVQKAKDTLLEVEDDLLSAMLKDLAEEILNASPLLLKSNAIDMAKLGLGNAKSDRLLLTQERIANIANSIRKIAELPSPTGKMLVKRTLHNRLKLQKITVPLGVVGAIYESRPNVTFDIAALCLRSRNACVLKGSSDAENSNHAAVMLIKRILRKYQLPAELVTLLPSDRTIVNQLYTATGYIDVLIPRGSASLIASVRQNSLVPVIETGAGVCHTYVHEAADLDKAVHIVVNAKVSRPSVCNALDTIIVDKKIAKEFLSKLAPVFASNSVGLFADIQAYKLLKHYPLLFLAKKEDFDHEFLSLNAAVKIVKGFDEALAHIAKHSTKHSEAIVSENAEICETFLRRVDAAVVYANASTRFTDGEEFGLGAEIGISTQKLHARGPFALEKLVTEKWIVRGNGQVR